MKPANTIRWLFNLAALALLAPALLTAGCIGWQSPHELDAATQLAMAAYEDKATAAPGQPPAAPPSRFATLPKQPAPAAPAVPPPPAAPGQPAAAPPASPEKPAGPALTTVPLKEPILLPGFVDPLTKTSDRVPVTLESCLRRALANNLSIQIARYGPAIAGTQIVQAEAVFDPSWFLNNAVGRIRQQAGSVLAGANTLIAKQWNFATGVETLLPTGASVGLTQDWSYLNTNSQFFQPNPQYDADLGLVLRQPILRGAGVEVNTSPIVLARLDKTISEDDFKAGVMDALLAVEVAYWQLVLSETQVQAVSDALEAARENRRIARRRFEEGKDKRVIVSLAESAVTSREADLVAARLRLTRASDALKRLLNDRTLPLEEPVVLQARELPLTDPLPVGPEALQASTVAAMRSRPELHAADARVSQTDVLERVARNGKLPQLDATAGYTLNGLEGKVDRAIDREFTHNFRDWTVGLEFSVPIGNRSRTAAFERSQLERSRALQVREDVRQAILLEVSAAVRTLAAAEESIFATRAARVAAEQTLHDMQAFVAAGAALVKDLLDAQRDLADARVREMDAMTNYMTSFAALERAKGTLLDYNNIRVLGDAEKKPAAGTP